MADQAAEGWLSPYLRRKRIAAVSSFLQGRILDVGCGSGFLASKVQAVNYVGIDVDEESLRLARERFPQYRFLSSLPREGASFDTIVSLATIEHADDPVHFLSVYIPYLNPAPTSRLVITTPHPSVAWLHNLGASVGIFSRLASEEHHGFLDRPSLDRLANQVDLHLIYYRRFLFGANQLVVFGKGEACN